MGENDSLTEQADSTMYRLSRQVPSPGRFTLRRAELSSWAGIMH